MKAVQINKYGSPQVIEINENTPKPNLAKNQILVKVQAVSINPIDWKVREGYLKEMVPLPFPITLGGDFAGIVTGFSEGVSDFKLGDEVYGQASLLSEGSGSFAEFVAANTINTALKPKKTNFIEASALPLAGSSALQALEEHIKLKKGQKILIHGGAGGIGHIAIQLAKALGAFVATAVYTDDKEFVKSLGADSVIDYKTQKFEQILKDYDAVFDTVGGEITTESFDVLKKGGVLVSMLSQPDLKLASKYGVSAIGQGTNTNKAHLTRLAAPVDSGKIKVHVDKVFPFKQVKDAFEYKEKIHSRGKVVVKI